MFVTESCLQYGVEIIIQRHPFGIKPPEMFCVKVVGRTIRSVGILCLDIRIAVCLVPTEGIAVGQPVAFQFNAETAVNNVYQNNDNRDVNEVQKKALEEFDNLVKELENRGITIFSAMLNFQCGIFFMYVSREERRCMGL